MRRVRVTSLLVFVGAVTMTAPAASYAAPAVAGLDVSARRRVPLSSPRLHGRLEHREFSWRGVPVRGAFETVHIAPDGATRITAARRPATDPQVAPEDAAIPAAELPGRVAEILGQSAPARFESPPTLVYLLVQDAPVLAWEVQLPLTTRPVPSRPTLFVSAMTGRLLEHRETVLSARARVFAENPSVTPEPIEVTLGGLDPQGAGEPLLGDRVVSLNCVTEPPDEVVPYYQDGDCYPAHLVRSDDAGDFFVPLPDIVRVEDNVRGDDLYAELSMYYHADRFLAAMRDLGVESFTCEPASMLANFRGIEPKDDFDYTPLNNAYYTGQCDPERGPTMIFGQGDEVDFGYDGDVVYHELGHGMVALLTPDGLGGARMLSDARVVDAGAINEAVADYFAFLMTDDPQLGDYVGRFWSGTGRPYIRSGENNKRCPEHAIGQVHNDGEAVQAALWATRSRVGPVFDPIVLQALTRLARDATFAELATSLRAVAQEMADADELDDVDLEVLERSLATRGLVSCARVITDPFEVSDGRTLHLRRNLPAVQPFWPGPMQLRYEVPAGDVVAEISMTLRVQGGDPPEGVVLVKREDAPIVFTPSLVAASDSGASTTAAAMIREVTRIEGDWDEILEPRSLGDDRYSVEVRGLAGGEVIHVALATTGAKDVAASGVAIRTPGTDADPAGDTDADTDAGHDRVPGDRSESVHSEAAVAGGCGCRGGAPGPGGAWLAGLCLTSLIGRRRRRVRPRARDDGWVRSGDSSTPRS